MIFYIFSYLTYYDIQRIMTFDLLWYLTYYDIQSIITFDLLWYLTYLFTFACNKLVCLSLTNAFI
jgi:hypothetical protein